MLLEFKRPKRFCTHHGCEMEVVGSEEFFDSKTGALSDKKLNYKCPRWFCGERDIVYVVCGGGVIPEYAK